MYAAAENAFWHLHNIELTDAAAVSLRMQLDRSSDPELLSDVGTVLTQMSRVLPNGQALKLLRKAIHLDPGNARWTEALEWAEAEPDRRRANERLMRAHSIMH